MKTLRISLVSLSVIVFLLLNSCGGKQGKNPSPGASEATASIEVSIKGMTCTGCEQTIQAGVGKIEGVNSVKADFKTGTALVEYNPGKTDTSMIRSAISGTGYEVTGFNKPASAEPVK